MRSSVTPGGGSNCTGSSEVVTHVTPSSGTPYSLPRSPFANTESVVWNERSATRLPMRSCGPRMPDCVLTYICDWLNSRRGKTGMAVSGAPRAFAMTYEPSDSSQTSNSRYSSIRS